MKKKLPFIIGVVLTIAAAVLYGNTNKTHKIYDNNVNTAVYQGIGILTEDNTVTQSFTCQEDRLDGFMIKSDISGNYKSAKVNLTVRDAVSGEVVATGVESGLNIKARKLHYYKIEPITGCYGKKFVLEVSESGSTVSDGILLYFQPGESVEQQELLLNGNSLGGVFVMKTVTERFDVETFLVMVFAEWFIWGFLWFLYRLFK